MQLKQDQTDQKLRGAYYTPEQLAKFIVDWSSREDGLGNSRILEPSCGDGVFLSALSANADEFNCVAVELDENEAAKASILVDNDSRFKVENADFYRYYEDNRTAQYDLILGNPPYIRYQYLSLEQREEQSDILINSGLRPNKLINSWVSFTVAAVQQLSNCGKIGFVIPAELLQVKYAEQLRGYLMDQLNNITIVTFRNLIFSDVEQEVVVLLGEKIVNSEEHKIKILEFDDIEDLENNFFEENIKNPFLEMENNNRKWTRYFLSANQNQLLSEILNSLTFRRFGEFAQVDVGITTGNNSFFCVDEDTANQFDLVDVSRPLLARAVNIPSVVFNHQDWELNVQNGAKTFLLDFNNQEPNEQQFEYIHLGETAGDNTGYKTRIRNRWYEIPGIWVPDAFFLRRNNIFPKFVLNQMNAVSTDTMHRVRFINIPNDISRKKMILSYYNSVAFAFTELEARSYGGGVLEILPRELEAVTIPDLINMDIDEQIVIETFDEVDRLMRNNVEVERILDLVDRVLEKELELDRIQLTSLRQIWRTLMNRRIGRGN
ncbi:N-6 DNA methylase [Enterococcus hulanensis]|uniref:N-6 DNA methylase n=1 Tax=Enterococcus hulanensis TaxID=2559929 RepID=UPI001A8DEF7D|nr:N-6 DNA methylase [Enterococcus hulanensis]MBO0457747.1 N-6 DNA methylase [Enterococcus hulanensis]